MAKYQVHYTYQPVISYCIDVEADNVDDAIAMADDLMEIGYEELVVVDPPDWEYSYTIEYED